MRVYIMTDLEGVAGGLDSENWCGKDSRYFDQAKELLTGEVNAAVEGFLDSGATDILVADGHGWGGINPSLLHPRAELAAHWPAGKAYPFSLDSRKLDVAAWIGQHPKAGTVGGHLCHTGSMEVREAQINGVSVGEFAEMALCAGELGVRVVLATGCEAFTREAAEFVPGIETVAVKRGTQTDPGHHLCGVAYRKHNVAAIHLSPEEARRRIREGAHRALERAREDEFGHVKMPVPPFGATMVLRPSEQRPARVLQKAHDSSVIHLLNAPWEEQESLEVDPLALVLGRAAEKGR
ncbi:MAG: M55 family metallopeptidase [Armatimonadetes bacterium]|nr:M55 family metallopeptidase [Armatimonadota bacterium]